MKNKKVNILSKILLVFLSVFFVVIIFSLVSDKFFEDEKNFVNELVASQDSGFSFYNLTRNLSVESKKNDFIVDLKPGESKSGKFLVKNHGDREQSFDLRRINQKKILIDEINYKETLEKEDFITGNNIVYPDIEFEAEEIVLGPKEWDVIGYEVRVPENFEAGTYYDQVVLVSNEKVNTGGSLVAYSIGIDFFVKVTDQPQQYNIVDLMDNVDQDGLLKERVKGKWMKYLAIVFGILTFFFLYLAYLDSKGEDGDKEKKTKESEKKMVKKKKKSKKKTSGKKDKK